MIRIVFILLTVGIAKLQAQNVGIGQNAPINKLDINGNMSIGSSYTGTATAPANGAIIEGNTGIGVSNPTHRLQVSGTSVLFNADFVNQEIRGVVNATNNVAPLPASFSQTITVGGSPLIVTIQGASGIPLMDSISITDGSGVNNSGVLILAQVNVNSSDMTFSGNGRANFLIRLQRAEHFSFTGVVTLYQSTGTAGLAVGATVLNTRDNVNIIYPDLALVAGKRYYYRIQFLDSSSGTTGGNFTLNDRSLTILQIKR